MNPARSLAMAWTSGPRKTIAEQIAFRIFRLDGGDRSAYKVGALPAGLRWVDVGFDWSAPQYVQCAGSSDSVAIEVRIVDENNQSHQFAVGHWPADGEAEEVRFGEHSVTVLSSEVFGAAEATEIFLAYVEAGEIPTDYVLREVDLG